MTDSSIAATLLALFGTYLVILLIWYILQVIAYWRVFTKAGQPGWKSIIPFYNQYPPFRIAWKIPYMYWVWLACMAAGVILSSINGWVAYIGAIASLAATIIGVLATVKLSKAYGHGIGFAIGMIFLGPIFMMILGFGSSQYLGPQD